MAQAVTESSLTLRRRFQLFRRQRYYFGDVALSDDELIVTWHFVKYNGKNNELPYQHLIDIHSTKLNKYKIK